MRLRQSVVGTLAALLSSLPSSATELACDRRPLLVTQPKWISSAEFNPNTKEILIADPSASDKKGALLAYSTETCQVERVSLPEFPSAASVTQIQGGFLLRYKDNAAVIGADKKHLWSTNLRNTKAGATGLGSLYSNWVTRESIFVGYGSVTRTDPAPSEKSDPARGFQLGFIRGKISASSRQFRGIELLDPTDANQFYLLGFPYFAANEDAIFYVRMVAGDEVSIMRVREGSSKPEKLSVILPPGFRYVPRLKTENIGPSSTAELFNEIERSQMVVGLFGHGKLLYILGRERNPAGEGTQWLLFQMDPDKDNAKPLRTLRLPTTTNHLSVVPASDYWYFIERGVVIGWGDQEIKSVLRIPTSWITSPSDPYLEMNSPSPPCEQTVCAVPQ